MSPTCPTCGSPLQGSMRPGTEHREGPVRAAAEPRRIPVCPAGCPPEPDPGLTVAALRAIGSRIVIARGGRLRSDRCGRCRSILDLPLRATSRSLTIEPEEAAPFTVTLDLPLGRCPGCGCDNLPAALSDAVDIATLTAIGAPVSRRRRRVARGSRATA